MKRTLLTILLLCSLVFAVSCSKWTPDEMWQDATYTEDATLGNGAKSVAVNIVAGEKGITLTVNTDKNTLSEALCEHNLVNDPSFFDTLAGMKADWAAHGVYWAFYEDGEYATVGIDEAVIVGGEIFNFVVTRG